MSANFDGGAISSDGGLLLLREADRRLGLTRMLASCVQDRRDPSRISHAVEEMLLFRMLAIACGHEDADDCDALRDDPLFKLAAGRLPGSGVPVKPTRENSVSAPQRPARSTRAGHSGRRQRIHFPNWAQIAIATFMTKTDKPAAQTISLAATLAIALAIGVLTLTHISDAGVPGSDKLHHFIAFAALTLPAGFARPRLGLWIALSALAYGGAIELIQPLVGREREFLDFVADGAGSLLGALCGAVMRWLWDRR